MMRTVQDLLTISTPQIVVGEHHDGRAQQVRAKHPLATGIEAVAVDQRDGELRHDSDAGGC